MASVDLDNLSDTEIRSKLIELGQPVGPVTGTTRKLYIKKLKSLLNESQSSVNLNSSAKFDPRNISHSSAEEESDEGSSRITRRSMPPPRTNKSPKRKSPTRAAASTEPIANSTFKEQKTSVKETFVSYNSPPTVSSYETKKAARSSIGLNNSATSQGIYGDDEFEHDISFPRSTRPLLSQATGESYSSIHSPPKFSSPDLGSGLSDAFKSRLQASGSTSYTSSYTSPRLSSSQPYASDFVRRLSSNRSVSAGSSNTSSISSKLLDVKESDDEDSGSAQVYTRFTQGGRSTLAAQGRGKGNTLYSDGWLPFDSPISAVLLLFFSLFIVLGVTYVNMHSTDTSLSSPSDLHYPICNQGTDSQQLPKVNCIREVDKDLTSKLFKIIYSELYERLKKAHAIK